MQSAFRILLNWTTILAIALVPLIGVVVADVQAADEYVCAVEDPQEWPNRNPTCCDCQCQGCPQQTCQEVSGGAGGTMYCRTSYCNINDPCMGTG